MAALTIGGVTVKVVSFRRLPDETSGSWTKRAWEADLIAVDTTERDNILAQVSAGPLIRTVNGQLRGPGTDETVSGDEIGSSITARVQRSEVDHVRIGTVVGHYALSVTIREV
jgi:hypothetical protein